MDNALSFPLTLQHLSALVAIHEEKSMTAAARRLGLAQPALSVAMAKLEARLAVDLLIREPRGVRFTAAGAALLARAYDILALTQSSVQELDRFSQQPQGEIAIGLPSSTAAVASIPIIERLSNAYPMVRLRVVEAFSGYLWRWLQSGEIDMAIVFDQESTADISCTRIAREDMHLVSQRRARQGSQPVKAGDLGAYPLAMPSRTNGFRATIETHAEQAGAALNIALEIDAGHQLVKLVASGRFHSILAPCAVADEIAQRRIIARPITPALTRTVCLAQRRLSRQSLTLERVAEQVMAECHHLISNGIWQAEAVA